MGMLMGKAMVIGTVIKRPPEGSLGLHQKHSKMLTRGLLEVKFHAQAKHRL